MRLSLRPVTWLLALTLLLTACGGHAVTATTATSTASTAVARELSTATSASAISTTTSASASVVSPAPAATATPVPVVPVTLQIPSLQVTAPIELVGLTKDGAMDVPSKWNDAGWYEYGPVPGQPGNAAIAGHLDSTTAPAIFWRLGSLKPGDKVLVTLSNNQTVTFVVTAKASYPYDNAPIDKIFGPAPTANLNLITCGGSWDAYTKNYSNRIVVYATKG